jgi:hypothetical protein
MLDEHPRSTNMDEDEIRQALHQCDLFLPKLSPQFHNQPLWRSERFAHCRYLMGQIGETLQGPLSDEQMAVVIRWLGFIEGVIWTSGLASAETLERERV